jgi:CDP-diacylglycerol--glycerol-3-phosphate 3-phosphatidyltransferase
LKSRFWNLPNSLTVARIALIPVVVWMLGDAPTRGESLATAVIFVVAMLTDIVDGYLARKWNLVTPLGAYLDPLADKLMVMTALIMLVPLGWVPAWLVLVLLGREMAITGLRGISSQEGLTISAGSMGKIKTAFQSTALTMLLLHYPTLGIDVHSSGSVLLWIATFFSLASGLEYMLLYFGASQKKDTEDPQGLGPGAVIGGGSSESS